MSNFCPRCKINFKTKQSLYRHIQRKNPCLEVKKSKLDTTKYPKVIIFEPKCNSKKDELTLIRIISKKYGQKHTVYTQAKCDSDTQNQKCRPKIAKSTPLFSCDFCNSEYKHKQNKYRHQKNCSAKINSEKKQKIKKLENRLQELESRLQDLETYKPTEIVGVTQQQNPGHQTNYNIQNNIQNNNNINITINGFGRENVESITKQEILEILNKRFEAFPAALERIYTIPENQNFYLPNKREKKYIKVFDGKKSYYENSEDFTYKLSNKIMEQLEEWFDTHNKSIKVQRRKLLKHTFDVFNEGQLYNRYKREIDMFLMTYSNSIKSIFESNIQSIRQQIDILENKK